MIMAFHGEQLLKQAVMDRLYEHRGLDQIVQRTYWEQGRGCHLGCITHATCNWHEEAERLFGIEQRIGYWLETVFEGLPTDDCARWAIESTEAIPCGADMSRCHHHFLSWLILDSGLLTITPSNREVVETVGNLHRRAIAEVVTDSEWAAAESVARSAESVSWAAESVSWAAAESAAESVARSAGSVPWAAESVAAKQSARSAAWRKIAAKSIEIFSAAPVVAGAIEPAIERELCCRKLWCREGVLVA